MMHDNAPIRFTIGDTNTGGRALILIFEENFQALDLAQQTEQFKQYLEQLSNDLKTLDNTDPNKAGIDIIYQVCNELASHIYQGNVPLDAPITIELGEPQSIQAGVDITHLKH